MKIAIIFEEEPIQWGLRGDPFLWRELKERLKEIEMPKTPELLKKLIEKEYEEATGYPITHNENFGIERFRSHGMSSGGIAPEFWVTTAIPLLISRHAKL
jgi:hypothetical protein